MSINVVNSENQSTNAVTQKSPGVDESTLPVLVTFLAVYFVASIVGNSTLFATLVKRPGQCTAFCIFSMNAAVINLLDALLNHVLVLTFVMGSNYDDTACRANATGIQLASTVRLLTLCSFAIDLYLITSEKRGYASGIAKLPALLLVIYTWAHGFSFSLPLMFSMLITLQGTSHHCILQANASLWYVCLNSIFCYLIPFAITLSFLSKVFKRVNFKHSTYNEEQIEQVEEYAESVNKAYTIFLFCCFICFLLFDGPYLTLYACEYYAKNGQTQRFNSSNNETFYLDVPPRLEVTFTWMRLSSSMHIPLLYFAWKKNIWQRLVESCCNKHSNSPNSYLKRNNAEQPMNETATLGTPTATKSTIPVLFATVDGLHIQTRNTLDDQNNVAVFSELSKREVDSTLQAVLSAHNFSAFKCDVLESRQEFAKKSTTLNKKNKHKKAEYNIYSQRRRTKTSENFPTNN